MSIAASALLGLGLFFILSAAIALLRFPDLYTRLHAVTKADNLGLGLIILAVSIDSGSWLVALKLLLVWFFLLLSSAVSGYLIAQEGQKQGLKPWQRDGCDGHAL
ncbi:MAG: monovalent cation/H(+) antiporter subunit G [Campylobacterales bacterium]